MLMAIGSILFVWFWMTVHTRSALVGATGILQIVLSLLVALFFYRMCFQILYFQVRSISRRRTISCPCRHVAAARRLIVPTFPTLPPPRRCKRSPFS